MWLKYVNPSYFTGMSYAALKYAKLHSRDKKEESLKIPDENCVSDILY